VGEEHAGRLVGNDLVAAPGVEELPGRSQESLGPLVPGILRQEAVAGLGRARRHEAPDGGRPWQRPGNAPSCTAGRWTAYVAPILAWTTTSARLPAAVK